MLPGEGVATPRGQTGARRWVATSCVFIIGGPQLCPLGPRAMWTERTAEVKGRSGKTSWDARMDQTEAGGVGAGIMVVGIRNGGRVRFGKRSGGRATWILQPIEFGRQEESVGKDSQCF